MAVTQVDPGEFAAAVAAAAVDDTLDLQPGNHTIAAAGSRFSLSKRLNIIGNGQSAGMFVEGTLGHTFDSIPVRVTGTMQITSGAAGSVLAGFGWQDNSASGPGTCLLLANSLRLQDIVISNRRNGVAGTIFFTVGGPVRPTGVVMHGIRSRLVGDPAAGNHDHSIYVKNCSGLVVEDSVLYEGTDGWALHFYPNGDNTIVRRCVVYGYTGGLTFSGAADGSTGLSGYLTSDANIVEDCILMNATRAGRYLIESWWSGAPPSGASLNIVRDSTVYQGAGAGGRISTANGGFTTSNLLNVDPLFTNPSIGDFRLQAGSPAAAAGQGPVYIQPGGSPPPPAAGAPTNLVLNVGQQSGQVTGSFTPPAAGTYDDFRVRRATGGYPANEAAGTAVSSSANPSFTDTGLTDGTTYYYKVWARLDASYTTDATAQATAVPQAPTQPDPDIAGKTTVGTTWRGMTPDVKRGWVVSVPPNKEIIGFVWQRRGTGDGNGTQAMRMFAYDVRAGVSPNSPLLGVSGDLVLIDDVGGGYLFTTMLGTPIDLPDSGGDILIGIHTGARGGTPSPANAEIQYSADVQAGALYVANDTYVGGTAATFGEFTQAEYIGTFYVLLQDTVPAPPSDPPDPMTGAAAVAGDGAVTVTWTNPADFERVEWRRATGGYPADQAAGTAVYSGTGTSFVDSGRTNGTQLYYRGWAVLNELYSTAVSVTATPSAAEPPPDPDPERPTISEVLVLAREHAATLRAAVTAAQATTGGGDDAESIPQWLVAARVVRALERAEALQDRLDGFEG